MKSKMIRCVMAGILMTVLMTGCSGFGNREPQTMETANETSEEQSSGTGFVKAQPGSYDSADTAVIVEKKSEESTITFYNIPTGRNYTLAYDGTTTIFDRYAEAVSLEQIQEGDIVDIKFLKSKKKLADMRLAAAGWSNQDVTNFEVNETKKDITIGTDTYKFTSDTILLSEGQQIEWMDINEGDTLTVNGIDTTVYSVVVDKGHGYLRLKNDEYFIGGWIEIGQSLIQPVTEDMLLVVPEGTYNVLITHKGGGGTKQVIINRDEETELDVGDLKGEDIQTGTVLFSVMPSTTTIYIDGEKVDISKPVEMEYGIHQMIAKADGYNTVTSYLKVGQAAAGIDVTLDAKDEDTEDEKDTDTEDEKDTDTEDEKDTEDEEKDTTEEKDENPQPTVTPDSGNTNQNTGNDKGSQNNNTSTITGSDSGSSSTNPSGDVPTTTTPDTAADGSVITTGFYKVYIDRPEGVEVYLDGNYIGIAPVNFKKEAGFHVVTLRKTGYETRSYTIQVDSEEKDISYTFDELEEKK